MPLYLHYITWSYATQCSIIVDFIPSILLFAVGKLEHPEFLCIIWASRREEPRQWDIKPIEQHLFHDTPSDRILLSISRKHVRRKCHHYLSRIAPVSKLLPRNYLWILSLKVTTLNLHEHGLQNIPSWTHIPTLHHLLLPGGYLSCYPSCIHWQVSIK